MLSRNITTFQKALDIIESLPEYQQESLIDIIRHRLREHKRETLATDIKKARKEYAQGEVKKGTVEDLLRDAAQ